MYYTEEEKLELKNKLQELINHNNCGVEAVYVNGKSVLTFPEETDFEEVYNFMCDVAETFNIDEDKLGGFSVGDKEILKNIGGYFYAERN